MPVRPPTFRPKGQRDRHDNRKDYEDKRQKENEWRAWYKREPWPSLRLAQLQREPLCERCLADDRVVAAEVVHHREPHRGDWQKFIDPENHASVCKRCHDGEIQRGERAGWTDRGWLIEGHRIEPRIIQPLGLQPSKIPLVMVCGAPGSGKSTYIAERKADNDIVIDIDAILSDLSGVSLRTKERREQYLRDAFIERNRRLASLSTATDGAAWFIIGAPTPAAREAWHRQLLPREVVVMETQASVCISRIRAVAERAPTAQGMIAGVHAWWDRYDRSPIDTLHIKH